MSLLSLLLGEKRKTASVARERLQIILAHERSGRGSAKPDYLPALQRELLAVISKYVSINAEDLKVPGQPGSAGSEDRAARFGPLSPGRSAGRLRPAGRRTGRASAQLPLFEYRVKTASSAGAACASSY